MSRCAVVLRSACPADVPALVDLWAQLRHLGRESLRPTRAAQPAGESVASRFLDLLADPECRIVVADCDGTVVGMALLTCGRVGQLLDRPAVQLTHVVVAESHRRRGVGRALVSAAVNWADEVHADEIVVSVIPTLREANRFYARLGFAPLVVRRVASVSSIRRRLAQIDRRPGSGDRGLRRRVLAGSGGPLRTRLAHIDGAEAAVAIDPLP